MYGLNEFDIQILSPTQIYEQIQFKVMMNQIKDPNLNKILDTFCELKSIIKCIYKYNELKINLFIKINYKFDSQTVFFYFDSLEL
jgi:hypothetical protein